MSDRVALITGATLGIGKVTARAVAPTVGTLVIVGRDAKRTEDVANELRVLAPTTKIETLLGDLSVMADIRRIADEFAAKHDRLHLLINNAGAIFDTRQVTKDGLEKTFALNHIGYFLLTQKLEPILRKSAPARVVSVASGAHAWARAGMRWDDLQCESYGSMRAYSQSKLANILFTTELARRLEGSGVTANCMHPGAVASGFGHNATSWIARTAIKFAQLFMLSTEAGADTIIHLALSPDVDGVTGKYFIKRKPRTPSKWARDDAGAKRLWDVSEKLVSRSPATA